MVNSDNTVRDLFSKKHVAQWARLPMPKLLELGYTEKQYGKIWYIPEEQSKIILEQAKKMQSTYEKSRRKNFGDTINKDKDLQNKSQGFKGEKALHSTLEEIGIDFKNNLRNFDSTKHHEKGDVILKNSNLTIEVKTGTSRATVLTINRAEWQALREKPDVVFALKLLEPEDGLILVKFIGWCFGSDVSSFEIDDGCYCKASPCYYRDYKEINKVSDIDAFLNGINDVGMSYLLSISGKNTNAPK